MEGISSRVISRGVNGMEEGNNGGLYEEWLGIGSLISLFNQHVWLVSDRFFSYLIHELQNGITGCWWFSADY